MEPVAGNLFQQERRNFVLTLQGLPIQKGQKHPVEFQPLGAVDRQDFHRGILRLGVRRLEGFRQVEVGLGEGGLGQAGFSLGQKLQISPGAGHPHGPFPGGQPGPGLGCIQPLSDDCRQGLSSYLRQGRQQFLDQVR